MLFLIFFLNMFKRFSKSASAHLLLHLYIIHWNILKSGIWEGIWWGGSNLNDSLGIQYGR